ncbi:hypothetical protein TIFTF001_002892 [Ficus carica]|uniref:Cytochrome P450 n=1 Tax=Ficus carica TaxID=3494 RepID=A0AA87ZX90_FICCA|nr:hypothetical protein TIFTF001_002892 [Ficus carica]
MTQNFSSSPLVHTQNIFLIKSKTPQLTTVTTRLTNNRKPPPDREARRPVPLVTLREVRSSHAPPLRPCPDRVVSSPDIVKEIAKKHDVVFSNRYTSTASDVLVLYHGGNNIVFAPYGEYWKRARKLCVLEHLSVESFRSVREEEVSSLVEKLREASGRCAGKRLRDADFNVEQRDI